MMKSIVKRIGMCVAVIAIAVAVLYSCGSIGIVGANIERDARNAHRIPEDWKVAKETTEAMSAMLFYPDQRGDSTFSIYVNRSGLSFGYFFRTGGSTGDVQESIAEFHIEGCNDRAFISMNEIQIDVVEIDDGNEAKSIEVDSNKPFALVLPINAGIVTFYDVNGTAIESIIHRA